MGLLLSPEKFYIGSCSWNYPEWADLGIYTKEVRNHSEYLVEYSNSFNTVEVDQWFWSLIDQNTIRLPRYIDIRNYNNYTPEKFIFTAKAPNSITLTHYYKSNTLNPNFLSRRLLDNFLKTLDPLKEKMGPIMFEFEYLNKNKMESLDTFIDLLDPFLRNLPKRFKFAIELRNANYLKPRYFDKLMKYKIGVVLSDGYYMPPIEQVYEEFGKFFTNFVIIRLLGKDRLDIEKKTEKIWNKIVEPRDETIAHVARIILDLTKKKIPVYTNINNHFEGSAPLSAEKLIKSLKSLESLEPNNNSGSIQNPGNDYVDDMGYLL